MPLDTMVVMDTTIPLEDGEVPDGGAVIDDAPEAEDTATAMGDSGTDDVSIEDTGASAMDGAPFEGGCGCYTKRTSPASPALLPGLMLLARRRRQGVGALRTRAVRLLRKLRKNWSPQGR